MSYKSILDYKSVISRKDGIDTTDLDGDKVMMDIDKGKYYVLNEIACDIWEGIAQPKSIRSIVEILMSIYNIDEKSCLDCTIEFLAKLRDEELVFVS